MRILELWRYPVSSVGGERLSVAGIGSRGVSGDRQFAIVDAETLQPAAPEKVPKWRKLLFLAARSEGLDRPIILFPDGTVVAIDDRRASAAISDLVGFPAAVCKYPLPELSHFDMSMAENRYKPAPLHIVSQSSIDRLSDIVGAPVDARRFRANLVVDGEDRYDFEENQWIGSTLKTSQVSFLVTEPTVRCGMTIVAQPEIEENADVLRTILRHNRRNFGAYCDVLTRGTVAVGDELLVD
jgi:uncharacterized protein YcbX